MSRQRHCLGVEVRGRSLARHSFSLVLYQDAIVAHAARHPRNEWERHHYGAGANTLIGTWEWSGAREIE